MSTQVGNLYRKSILRDLNGNVRNWLDETDGGWIIKDYQVVNQEKYNEHLKKEEDRKLAARAQAEGVAVPQAVAENRAVPPSKLEEFEKRLNNQDEKLDKILEALSIK